MGFFSNLFKTNSTVKTSKNVKPNSLEDALNKCRKYNIDTFIMFTCKSCDYCSKYGVNKNGKGKVYSISGKSKKYPSMMTIPADLVIGRCPKCDRAISFNPYFE